MFVAECDGKVVGVLYATIESADDDEVTHGYHRVSVDEVSVDPEYRSMKIGSKLMQEVENWAKENEISDLTTLVYAFNDRAVKFYEDNGYKPYSIKLNKKI
jgi:ribosomal protein S18 acetylase RimI-like enzyme